MSDKQVQFADQRAIFSNLFFPQLATQLKNNSRNCLRRLLCVHNKDKNNYFKIRCGVACG